MLQIKDICIHPPLALAPMVGLSHSALRSLIAGIGGAGIFFSEMLSAKRLPGENEKVSPYLCSDSSEEPLFYQIYVSHEREIDGAVERLEQLGARGIDLNLGCPAPQLRKIGAGQFLCDRPDDVLATIRRLRGKTNLPVSVKIRIGDSPDALKLRDMCVMLEQEGIDLITIHARLAGEKFCRKPRWELLVAATSRCSVPILANGGVFTVEDARLCLERSGADGLMIGRGAVRQPWIFKEIAVQLYGWEAAGPQVGKKEIFLNFVSLLRQRFRPERRLGRLKEFTHYYASGFSYGHHLAARIQSSITLEQAVARAEEFFKEAETAPIQ